MRNKMILGIILLLLVSVTLFFYQTGKADVSIVDIGVPSELGTLDSGYAAVMLQNNASKDTNVTLNVKNAIEDENGISLPTPIVLVDVNYEGPSTFPREINLKPGINKVNIFYGYQVPGKKIVEVEVSHRGKLIDTKSAEITVHPPVIGVSLQYTNESRPSYDIYKVFGSLSNTGKGTALGVEVNISIINETTSAIVSSTIKRYSLRSFEFFYPMSVWEGPDKTQSTLGPIAVIELSSGAPSNEKYLLASTVAKGKVGDRYKVVVTARWQDQIAKAEMVIPP